MKKLLLVLVCLFAMASMAIAAEPEKPSDTTAWYTDTQRGIYTTPSPTLTDYLNGNPYFYHSHQVYIDQRRNPLGVGLDLVVYEGAGILENVAIQSKYDFQNDEMSGFLVGRVNVFKTVKNYFNF